ADTRCVPNHHWEGGPRFVQTGQARLSSHVEGFTSPKRKRRNEPMTVLVTGGAGFIGSHLVRLLLDRGASVRVLERPGAHVQHLPLDGIELLHGDIRDEQSVRRAVRGCTEVYHLAANPHLWALRRGEFHQVNYRGTVNVLEAALVAGARRI